MEGYELNISTENQIDLYDVWETNTNVIEKVIEYYKSKNEVRWYEKGGECDSYKEKLIVNYCKIFIHWTNFPSLYFIKLIVNNGKFLIYLTHSLSLSIFC